MSQDASRQSRQHLVSRLVLAHAQAVKAEVQGTGSARASALAAQVLEDAFSTVQASPAFAVSVSTMAESHCITYLVTLRCAHKGLGSSLLDTEGVITPYVSESLEQALFEAQEWADFLGVQVQPYQAPPWLAETKARLELRARTSLPQAGAD